VRGTTFMRPASENLHNSCLDEKFVVLRYFVVCRIGILLSEMGQAPLQSIM
jgi:hypothetical protein